jgi:hypothetical protein
MTVEKEFALRIEELSQLLGIRYLYEDGKITHAHLLMRMDQIRTQTQFLVERT